MCAKPFRRSGLEFGCGQCLPCRINRRRTWTARLVLESCLHEKSWFVTLTYSELWVPEGNTLVPRDVVLFMKRLRRHTSEKIRYYCVGEYGDANERPHYHLLLFGLKDPSRLQEFWGLGSVHVGFCEPASVQYCTGYVTKGMTKWQDERLKGRHPEFCRMSLKPGIGGDCVAEIARICKGPGKRLLDETGDVPFEVRIGGKKIPLARYIRDRLRLALGREVGIPAEHMREVQCEFLERMKRVEEAEAHEAARRHHINVARARDAIQRLRRFNRATV